MIALLEADKSVKVRGGVAVRRERLCGVHVLRVTVKADRSTRPRRLEKLYSRALAELSEYKADAVCFKEDFPGRTYFAASGLYELSMQTLFEKEAANIARLASPGGGTAAVFAARIMRRETETIKCLARDFRHVLLFTGSCQTALVRDLGERLGASLIDGPSAAMLEEPDVAVFFHDPTSDVTLPEKCTAIPVMGEMPENVKCAKYVSGVRLYAPAYMEQSLPEGYPRDVLLSALVAACAPGSESVHAEEITVVRA